MDAVGSTVSAGEPIVRVADLGTLRAKIYVSEWDMHKVELGAQARIQVGGLLKSWVAQVDRIESQPKEMASGLSEENNLNGLMPLHFYVAQLRILNPEGKLRPGMTGTARIYGARRSLGGTAWQGIRNFWGRKLW